MASPMTTVQPGDLIRADLINQLFSELASLDRRLTALEIVGGPTGGSVLITSVVPSGPIRVDEEMQLRGQHFGFSIGAHRVFIDGIRVMAFKNGSDDDALIFDIPDIPALPASGRPVTLSVSNQTTTDTRTVVVLPALIALGGTVDVGFESVTPTTFLAGQSATFRYRARSRANQPAQFQIASSVSGVSNVADWQNALKILNDDESENTPRTVALEPQQEKFFKVRLAPVPATPPAATFTLTTSVKASGVRDTPDSRAFTVGQVIEQPDPTISLNFLSSTPPSAVAGTTLSIAQGGAAKLSLMATFTATGTYRVTRAVTAGTGWTIELFVTTPSGDFPVTEADLANPPHQRLVEFIVRAQGASATGKGEFRVERVGGQRRIFALNFALPAVP